MNTSLFLLISLGYFSVAAANFQDGEFVPTARRAQFHGVRCVSEVVRKVSGVSSKERTGFAGTHYLARFVGKTLPTLWSG